MPTLHLAKHILRNASKLEHVETTNSYPPNPNPNPSHLEKQHARLLRRKGPIKTLEIARKRLAREPLKRLVLKTVRKLRSRGEWKKAMGAARASMPFPILALPSDDLLSPKAENLGMGTEYGGSDDEGRMIVDERAENVWFPGKVVIRDRVAAITHALAEYKQWGGRNVFWVDGATYAGYHGGSIAVLRVADRGDSRSAWVAEGYRVDLEAVDQHGVEAWAIWKALRMIFECDERERSSVSGKDDACSLMVVYSDCQDVLRNLMLGSLHCDLAEQRIIGQAQELEKIGITMEIHWVPGHVGIPGIEAADLVAKRALRA
ncbi:uncharacterized protein KY384_002401 [Bacidia gigantensis]|uniref:uncharacterized protein n=1 Tax=Bacidia gigantensis TaxID=2732470 RepID=UPI001D04EFB9|nr:uncharacterized protein KY384_002401 [Bacidia gigantensis]KAG8532524.1 hypothetical protein KY384_002401 [Bacidia gigantensis]